MSTCLTAVFNYFCQCFSFTKRGLVGNLIDNSATTRWSGKFSDKGVTEACVQQEKEQVAATQTYALLHFLNAKESSIRA